MILKLHENNYVEILSYRHLKTGQGHTESIINYMDLGNFKFGKMHVNTHHKFDRVDIEFVPAVVQYIEGDKVIVSETSDFEQIEISTALFQGAEKLFPPGTPVTLVQDGEGTVIKISVSPDQLDELRKLKPKH